MLPRSFYNEENARKRQIDTLKIFNENVIEITENSEYRVDFVADGKNFSLTVKLSAEFPTDKPAIYVTPVPCVKHPWVDDSTGQVVGAPGLLNYTQHSDLGRIVQAISREFQISLPTLSSEDSSPQAHLSTHSLMFPELAELNIEELQEILENPDLQDKLLESSPQLLELDLETEELVGCIEQIAQENLARQHTLGALKTDVLDRVSCIMRLKSNYDQLNKRHQQLAEMYSPHRIRECLKEAALKADEDADAIAEQFLLGSISVDSFVTQFAERRALGQARRAREERLAHQLAQLHRAAT